MRRLTVWIMLAILGVTLSGCCGWGWYCGGGHDRGGGGWDRGGDRGGDHERDRGGDRGPEGRY